MERASKIGHVKIIEEPRIQRILEAWEKIDGSGPDRFGNCSGHIDLDAASEIENVVAFDGSYVAVPNDVNQYKKIAFISVGAVVLRRSALEVMARNPIIDPRDLSKQLTQSSYLLSAALPLSGVRIPGETLVQTLRRTMEDVLRYTKLYETLQFLVFRRWDPQYQMVEHMDCLQCGMPLDLAKNVLTYDCSGCAAHHTLVDYLGLTTSAPEDWASEEAVIGFTNILETLLLIFFMARYRDREVLLRRSLFLKDGPLLLRAQLSRLVEPIRAFLDHLHGRGRTFHLLGVEKTGALVEHVPLITNELNAPGDYFLPSVQYLHERIHGVPFVAATYRNRVQYGSKMVVRLGPQHVVALDVPPFRETPSLSDLHGFEASAAVLSSMLSSAHENALVPIVLANSAVSISWSPSREILSAFAERLLGAQ